MKKKAKVTIKEKSDSPNIEKKTIKLENYELMKENFKPKGNLKVLNMIRELTETINGSHPEKYSHFNISS